MPKYSTDSTSSERNENSCELCGEETDALTEANIAGARLSVCQSCAPHDERGPSGAENPANQDDSQDRGAPVPGETPGYTITQPDSSWVEEDRAEYQDDPLPYLKRNYPNIIQDERQRQDLTVGALATEADVPEESIESLESGDATEDSVPGSHVEAVEETLEVVLSEQNN